MTAKPAKNSPKRTKTGEILLAEAARKLELTSQGVGQFAAKPGAPVRKAGARVYVRWPEFMRWREQELCRQAVAEATKTLREQLDRATGTPGGDPMLRKMTADARKAEIDVELLERSVIKVADAESVIEKLLTDLRAQLIPFPRTAAPKLLGAKTIHELEQRLDSEVQRVMEVMANPPAVGEADQANAA